MAVIVSIAWGIAILMTLSYFIARAQGKQPWKTMGEHVLIAAVVIAITQGVGSWIASLGA